MTISIDVRIVELPPMTVASAIGYGSEPEGIALDKIFTYARANGLKITEQKWFGFNNPNPSPGSPNYGYEQWLVVPKELEQRLSPTTDVQIKHFKGGRFAVTRTKLITIGEAWQRLVAWAEDSPHNIAYSQCLEEALNFPEDGNIDPEVFELDLYLPISD